MPQEKRVIFHCDCNSFYASAELLSHPELRGVPVAVCGSTDDRHGIILAKNEAAKRAGIVTAETAWSAKRKCPQLVFLPPHHEKYRALSRQINEIYQRFTDRVEPFGIDEDWLDMTHTWMLFGASPEETAHLIRRTVKAETGLTISVGVSFTKVFAKFGSDYKKPDAVTVISRENYRQIIWPQPVGALLFVGSATQHTLEQLGVRTIGQLAALGDETLRRALGRQGPVLGSFARGTDDTPVRGTDEQEEVKSIGNGMTFRRDLVSREDIRAGLWALSDEVAERLRAQGLYAQTVQVTIKDPQLKSIQRQKQLDAPTHFAKELCRAAEELVHANRTEGAPVRMLTVTALNLTDGSGAQQLSFFDEHRQPQDDKHERLAKSLDSIRKKYGRTAIAPGNVLNNDIGLEDISVREKEENQENR